MSEPLDQDRRQVVQVRSGAPDEVVLEHGDDLVVGLAAVEKLQAADDARGDDNLRMIDRTLAHDTNIERIAITALGAGAQRAHRFTAVRLRDEAVQRRRLR